MSLDLLCICPHSDDAEIALGGTLRRLVDRGRQVWVCDLTRGELASNATPDERWREAQRASEVLGLTGRVQLALPDGFIAAADPAQVAAVTAIVRRLRPRFVATAPEPVRHPDHVATPALVARAVFLAHLATYRPSLGPAHWWPMAPVDATADDEPWRVEAVFETCPEFAVPSLIFDVSETWQDKRDALNCYASQFVAAPGRRPTYINTESFSQRIESRGRLWGHRAGVEYGEALRSAAVPVLVDLPQERWA